MNVARHLKSSALLIGLAMAGACNAPQAAERTLKGETITVGCGSCMFHMPEAQGCPFAAEVDGKHYLIQGRVPENHEPHAKDGICVTTRQAVVDGEIRGDKLITTRLDLKPASDVPPASAEPVEPTR